MNILLIVPTHRYAHEYPAFLSVSDFPQGYAYLAAALKKAGHKVTGLNLNNITGYSSAQAMIQDRITAALSQDIDLIGIGGLAVDYPFVKDAIGIIRRISKAPIVLGGNMITHDGEFLFKHLKPDYAITGEAEENLVRLANLINDVDVCEREHTNGHVDNLWFWSGDQAMHTAFNHKYGDLDDRAFPDYEPFGIKDMVDNYSDATRLLYRYSRPDARPFNISASRSCPFTCTFCIHGRREIPYRARSIPNVMAEIREMHERYKFNVLIILDELFAVNKQRMRAFCQGVLEGRQKHGWDFDWMFQTHASARFDPETLKLAKRAGCFLFSYGIESASPTVLNSMGKRTQPEQIVEAIKLAEDAGIAFSGNLIFGDPAETPATICESVAFYAKHCDKAFVFTSTISPYPGSKLFDDLVAKGVIKDKVHYYENIDKGIWNMTGMPNEVFHPWLEFVKYIDKSWHWVKRIPANEIRETDLHTPVSNYYQAKIYDVTATCPYCGAEIKYRNTFKFPSDIPQDSFLGVACTKCERKIRIDLTKEAFNAKGDGKETQSRSEEKGIERGESRQVCLRNSS